MQYAPIIIFAFNRLEPLKNTVASLLRNTEAAESDLFVFVDGARQTKEGEAEKVELVKDFVKSIPGFKSLHCIFSDKNKGLGPSIIDGVTEVMNQYGRVIVLEDDLVVQSNFLAFMNQGLDHYEQEQKVFSVCGYTNKVRIPKKYAYNSFLGPRSSSWGWATWKDRWCSVDWYLKDWDSVKLRARDFNCWGGSDCFGMLKDWKEGRNKSWAIRFCYAQFMQDKLSLFPNLSLIDNEGFDGSGTNCCSYSRFHLALDNSRNKDFVFPASDVVSRYLIRQSLRYHSIPIRAYSRIRYIINDLKQKVNSQYIMNQKFTPPQWRRQERIVELWDVSTFHKAIECITSCLVAA